MIPLLSRVVNESDYNLGERMLPNVGFGEIAVVFVIGLIVFGPDKLPKIARGLAEAMRAFRDELRAVNAPIEPKEEPKDVKAETVEPAKPFGSD